MSIVNSSMQASAYARPRDRSQRRVRGAAVPSTSPATFFEANKGYGILNAGGLQVAIVGNYFEANGNSIGILALWGTTVDTNHFQGSYGQGWNMNRVRGQVVSDKAHIIVASKKVQLRNNNYAASQPIMVFRLSGKNVFDARPITAQGVKLPPGTKIADAGGLGVYVYNTDTGDFVFREFHLPTEDEVFVGRIRQAQKNFEAAKGGTADNLVGAQVAMGNLWLDAGDYARARVEYQKAFQYPENDQSYLRSSIQLSIADSYMKEKKYAKAVAAYEKAQKIGLGGWRVGHAANNLKKAKKLAGVPGDT